MGAGVLAYPYTLRSTGYVAGPVLALVAAVIMLMTLQVVARASDAAFELARKGEATMSSGSYQEIVVALLGRFWGKVLTWLLFTYLTLSNICYITILYDQAEPIILAQLGESSILNKRFLLVPLCGVIVGYPLALIPNMSLFSIPSTLSQFGVIFGVVLVFYYSFHDFKHNDDIPSYKSIEATSTNAMDYLNAFPIFAFSFQCHITFPLIYASMKDRTYGRITAVNTTTVLGCLVIYLLMGISGYLYLGAATPDDILEGLCGDGKYYEPSIDDGCCIPLNSTHIKVCPKSKPDILNIIARACVFVKVACSYGMLVYVCRTCIKDIVLPVGKEFTRFQHHLETVLYVIFTVGMGIIMKSMTIPMAFAGILVIIIDIVFPGIMQLKLAKSQFGRIMGYVTIGFGTLMVVVCIVSSAIKIG